MSVNGLLNCSVDVVRRENTRMYVTVHVEYISSTIPGGGIGTPTSGSGIRGILGTFDQERLFPTQTQPTSPMSRVLRHAERFAVYVLR